MRIIFCLFYFIFLFFFIFQELNFLSSFQLPYNFLIDHNVPPFSPRDIVEIVNTYCTVRSQLIFLGYRRGLVVNSDHFLNAVATGSTEPLDGLDIRCPFGVENGPACLQVVGQHNYFDFFRWDLFVGGSYLFYFILCYFIFFN